MNEKILTISIAAYNVEKYIGHTLDSLIDDEIIDDLEIFVVDDGGTDRTLDIAKNYAKKYPDSIYCVHKKNGGYGSTINQSVHLSTAKYFKQLDGDDWFETEGLIKHVKTLKKIDADMVITPNYKVFESDGHRVLRDNAIELAEGIYHIDDFLITSNINMHSVTYRTDLLKNIGPNITEHCFYTDTEYVMLPFSKVKLIAVSHDPIYCYRIGLSEQSMSINGIRRHYQDHEIVLRKLINHYNKLNLEKNATKVISRRIIEEAKAHYRYLCMLPISADNKKKLLQYDNELKQYNDIYKSAGATSKFVTILRKSNFMLYRMACYWAVKMN